MKGQLIRKGHNSWLLRIYKGHHAVTKKRIYKATKFRGDEEHARIELNKFVAEQEKAAGTPQQMTVNELLDQWFARVAENRYAERTQIAYQYMSKRDIRPVVGHIRLSDLQATDIQRIFSAMAARGVSSNTRRKVYSVLSIALDCAVAWGILEANPMAHLEIPRREKSEMRAMSKEEVTGLLAVTDKGPLSEYFRTAVITGMRPGELAGLRWDDLDPAGCIICVQRSLWWKKSGKGWILSPPKTTKGRREITISKSLVVALMELKKRQDALRDAAGANYKDEGFIFVDETGSPLKPHVVTRVFKEALATAGLAKDIRLYDLRHTSATLLLKAGENIKVVSERLGHANVSITLEIYAHVLPGMQRDAANRMEELLNGDPKHTE
ncbi:MAG: integrase [Blastocatellia bacterium]|jgi:integrase|nr:integrase [Blastocatellia bacterium]